MNSFRREFINFQIDKNIQKLRGIVADFGGSNNLKSRTKIKFTNNIDEIISINKDPNSQAQVISDLKNLPFKDEYFDSFLLLEVLEHVENPEQIIKEIFRVSKKDAIGFVSMPFLYQIHMAPKDYRRWTKEKIINVFEKNDFTIDFIIENGGLPSVIFDLIRSYILSLDSKKYLNKFKFLILKFLKPLFQLLERKNSKTNLNITTGYFLIIKKN
ncbi:MAG: hypothetical protein CL824_03500 [Crocinitomicaceae bacterium]|nr:hypothetical protein [Crocinitomicaceae bacterium]